jgi:hypothetical protein
MRSTIPEDTYLINIDKEIMVKSFSKINSCFSYRYSAVLRDARFCLSRSSLTQILAPDSIAEAANATPTGAQGLHYEQQPALYTSMPHILRGRRNTNSGPVLSLSAMAKPAIGLRLQALAIDAPVHRNGSRSGTAKPPPPPPVFDSIAAFWWTEPSFRDAVSASLQAMSRRQARL